MNRWTRKIRWIVALSTMLVLLASTTVVYGGLRWTGIDPELDINGKKVNVTAFWPEEHTCDVDEKIYFSIQVPRGSEVSFEESKGRFKCDEGATTIKTHTKIVYKGRRNEVKVTGYVGADGRFPVRILVQGEDERRICKGHTNSRVRCRPLSLGEPDDEPEDKAGRRGRSHRGDR